MKVEKQNRVLSPLSISPKQRHASNDKINSMKMEEQFPGLDSTFMQKTLKYYPYTKDTRKSFSIEDKRKETFSQRALIQAMRNGSRHPTVPQTSGTVAQMTKINMNSLTAILDKILLSDIIPHLSIHSEVEHPVIKLPIKNYILMQLQYIESNYSQLPDIGYNALLLSCVMNTLAEIVTLKETVLRFRPRIAQKLITYFQNDLQPNIQQSLSIQPPAAALTLEIAKSLNNEDPIELYLKKIIPAGEAAMMICNAAIPPNLTPLDYFELLVSQFKCRILAIGRKNVIKSQPGKRDDGGSSFELKDVVGYTSTEFFDYVNGGKGYDAAGDFVIDTDIETRLHQLQSAIQQRIDLSGCCLVPAIIENTTANIQYQGCCQFIQNIMQCHPEDTLFQLGRFKNYLKSLPIQISIPHSVWFSSNGFKSNIGTHYKPMAALIGKQMAIADMILSREAQASRRHTNPSNETVEIFDLEKAATLYHPPRPIEYPGWRMDKDSRSAQHELTFTDCPVFGALCFWDTEKYKAGMSNMYGDLNFYLSTSFIRNNPNKIHYKATVTSPERSDILDMFEDLIRDERYHFLAASLLARFLGKGDLRFPTTELEVIIYGGFDIQSDTNTNINIGETSVIPDDVMRGMNEWALIQHKKIQSPDTKYTLLNYATNQKVVLLKILRLEMLIRDILNNPIWNSMGTNIISKTPQGIKDLRIIFATPDAPTVNKLEKMKMAIQNRLSKKSSKRNELVQNLYDTLNKIDLDIIPQVSGEDYLNTVYQECSQFATNLQERHHP